MTPTGSNITQDITPVEAANLLAKLEEGHQAAWMSTYEVPWHSAEYQSRFQNATPSKPRRRARRSTVSAGVGQVRRARSREPEKELEP